MLIVDIDDILRKLAIRDEWLKYRELTLKDMVFMDRASILEFSLGRSDVWKPKTSDEVEASDEAEDQHGWVTDAHIHLAYRPIT